MTQFRNTDAARKPQKLHIEWERKFIPDDYQERPDEHDEGFWPSRDPEAAGYCGDVSDEEFQRQHEAAEQRMADWENDVWYYGGVVAVAHLLIPIGGSSFRIMEVESAGIWGVESDAGEYLDELFADQQADLLGELETIGKALASGDYIQKGGPTSES